MHLGLIYGALFPLEKKKAPVAPPPFRLVGYVNSNYVGNLEDKKSLIRHCFFIHGAIVSSYSKKQRTVSISITEAKYIALGYIAHENVWIRRFFNELKVANQIGGCMLHGDNKTSIIFTNNAES